MGRLGEVGMTELQAAASISRRLVSEAYLLGMIDICWVSGWLSVG